MERIAGQSWAPPATEALPSSKKQRAERLKPESAAAAHSQALEVVAMHSEVRLRRHASLNLGPSDAELATPGNWVKVYFDKNIRIVAIRHNI